MTDIHDILGPYTAPDYSFIFWILLALFFIWLIIYLLFFRKRKAIDLQLILNPYKKDDFLKDLKVLENLAEKDFKKEYWKELSQIFKKFIWKNVYKKIFFLSFWEISREKKFEKLLWVFETFNKEFFSREKKWSEDFRKSLDEIRKNLDWLN